MVKAQSWKILCNGIYFSCSFFSFDFDEALFCVLFSYFSFYFLITLNFFFQNSAEIFIT